MFVALTLTYTEQPTISMEITTFKNIEQLCTSSRIESLLHRPLLDNSSKTENVKLSEFSLIFLTYMFDVHSNSVEMKN
jgi:hypothetical protein